MATSGATVLQAARMMSEHHIGALVVVEQESVIGVVTERDVMQRVVAMGLDPLDTLVGEIMTREVVCCEPSMPIAEARNIMKQRRIRHLPAIGPDHELVGIISIGDLNAHELDDQEVTIHFLHEYLYGTT